MEVVLEMLVAVFELTVPPTPRASLVLVSETSVAELSTAGLPHFIQNWQLSFKAVPQ